MEFTEVVKSRYSCKKYDGRQITQAQLGAILEAGRLAPTAEHIALGEEAPQAGQLLLIPKKR